MENGGTSAGVLRLFVAISLPEAMKDEIEKAQRNLREALPGNFVRWTRREQFHLTLKFLGNVEDSRVAELTTALRKACGTFSQLRLRAKRIGFFPDARYPRVLWVGVRDAHDALLPLQTAIEAAAKGFTNEQPEKAFSAHVTLGRIQRIPRAQAEALAKVTTTISKQFFGEWAANKVELIRSELSSSGSRYTTLADISLP